MIVLPWPPSVNTYWRTFRGRMLISEAGRRYRTVAMLIAGVGEKFGGQPVVVTIEAWFPDLRKRDLDNLLKAPLDALTHAGVYEDDSQIVGLHITRAGLDKANPRLEIKVEPAIAHAQSRA